MSDLKARRGQPVTADAWNKVVDRLPVNRAGQPAGGFGMSRVELLIRNDSGNDRDLGELLVIDDDDDELSTDPYELAKGVILSAVDPVWHSKISRIVVLAEPIPDEGTGKAVLSGVCVVKCVGGSTYDHVMVDPATINRFLTGTGGIGRVIYHDGNHTVINLRDGQNFWRYELTEDSQGPEVTAAKLIHLDGTVFNSDIELSDPLSLMDDQVSGDKGFCIHCGNTFQAIQAPC